MTKTDIKLYKTMLEHLKSGKHLTISGLSKDSGLCRNTIYSKLDKHTFQNLKASSK